MDDYDNEEFDYISEQPSPEQEEQSRFMQYCYLHDDDYQKPISEQFYIKATSEYNLVKIAAFNNLQSTVYCLDINDFEQDIFSHILARACIRTQVKYNQIKEIMPSVMQLLRRQLSIAEEVAQTVAQDFIKQDVVNEQEMNYIIKQIQIDQISDLTDSILRQQNNNLQGFQIIITRLTKYIIPIIVATIRSSICNDQITSCYEQLYQIMTRVKLLYKQLDNYQYTKFDKIFLPINDVIEYDTNNKQNCNMIDQLYQQFMDSVCCFCFIIPYMKTQMFLFKNQREFETMLQLFSFIVEDKHMCFKDDVYNTLNNFTYPIVEGHELDIFNEVDGDMRKYLIENEISILQITCSNMQDITLHNFNKFSKFFTTSTREIVLSFLCRHYTKRSLHVTFIKKILSALYLNVGKAFDENSIQTQSISSIIQGEIQYIQQQESEYSLKQNDSLYQSSIQDVIVTISQLISRMSITETDQELMNDIVNVILHEQQDEYKIINAYCLPSFVKVVNQQVQMKIINYYYQNLKNEKGKIVQSYLKNIGNFLQIVNEQQDIQQFLDTDDQCLKEIANLAYDFIKGNPKFNFFNCKFNNHHIVRQNFMIFNTISISSIYKLKYLLCANDKSEYSQLINIMKPQSPNFLQIKYSLFDQFLSQSKNFHSILNSPEGKAVFIQYFNIVVKEHNIYNNIQVLADLAGQYSEVFEVLMEQLHNILIKSILKVNENLELNQESTLLFKYQNNQYTVFINRNYQVQGQIVSQQIRKLSSNNTDSNSKKHYKFEFKIVKCTDYQDRLQFASELPSMVYKLCNLIQQREQPQLFQQLFFSCIDTIVILLYDPVRKIRTTFIQKLGVLIGLLINDNIDLQLVLQAINYFSGINNKNTNTLQTLFQKQRASIQIKCQFGTLLYYIMQTVKQNPYQLFEEVLAQLSNDSSEIVRSTIIKTMFYLAANNNIFVFDENFVKFSSKFNDSGDQAVLDFFNLYQAELQKYIQNNSTNCD